MYQKEHGSVYQKEHGSVYQKEHGFFLFFFTKRGKMDYKVNRRKGEKYKNIKISSETFPFGKKEEYNVFVQIKRQGKSIF